MLRGLHFGNCTLYHKYSPMLLPRHFENEEAWNYGTFKIQNFSNTQIVSRWAFLSAFIKLLLAQFQKLIRNLQSALRCRLCGPGAKTKGRFNDRKQISYTSYKTIPRPCSNKGTAGQLRFSFYVFRNYTDRHASRESTKQAEVFRVYNSASHCVSDGPWSQDLPPSGPAAD